MDFYEAVAKRRTVRDFTGDPVPAEIVERILAAGLQAPSNDHLRSWEFVVMTDRAKTAEILKKIPKKASEKRVDFILRSWRLADSDQQAMYRDAIPKQYDMLSRSGCLLLPFFKQDKPLLAPKNLSALNPFASIWCCIENILLAVTAAKIWAEFSDKLQNDQLTKADFTGPMGAFLYIWLSGPDTSPRREKFARAPARFWEPAEEPAEKAAVFLSCPDDTYRFDFVRVAKRFALAFVECITLPVENLKIPCRDFQTLPEKEAEIRAEKEISRHISLYLRLKALLGREEAVGAFLERPCRHV